MTIVITAFERSPDGGPGLARDTRVRWALEEVGQPYEVRLVSLQAKMEPAHLRLREGRQQGESEGIEGASHTSSRGHQARARPGRPRRR